MHFRESHVCANKLDVQETNFSFTQLYRSGNNFSWCRLTHGWYSRSHNLGFGDWNMSFRTEQDWTTRGRAPEKPVAGCQAKHAQPHPIQAHQHHSGACAMLYVFEDNEAVIKMIITGRSPTMRHVSRTHRVALDWLFDKINLDPKIQIRHIDSKHQAADILTKRSFTRDEWNNLLHLFVQYKPFQPSLRCTRNFSLISCTTMTTRI